MKRRNNIEEKYQRMVDNYINGNQSDFRNDLKGLNKLELIYFISFMRDNSYLKIGNVIALLERHLEEI